MTATRFTEAQISRAIKGALKAGLDIGEVKVDPDGTIRILPKTDTPPHDPRQPEPEPW